MGISIDITANAQGFIDASKDAASGLSSIADRLEYIAQNADLGDGAVGDMFQSIISDARQYEAALQQTAEAGTEMLPRTTEALQEQSRYVAQLEQQYRDLATAMNEPMAIGGGSGTSGLKQMGDDAEESGQKIEESGKLAEGMMMNIGYSAMSASSLFTDGLAGMAEQVGSFAAFLGPSLAGADDALEELAWPITLAGVAVAALAGLFSNATTSASTLNSQVQNLISSFEGSYSGGTKLDEGLRAWAKSADDFGGTSLNDLQQQAKQAGINFGSLAQSIATQSLPQMQAQQKAVQELTSKLEDQDKALQKQAQAQNAAGGAASVQLVKNQQQLAGLTKLNSVLQTNIENTQSATNAEKKLADQMDLTLGQYQGYYSVLEAANNAHVSLTSTQKLGLQAALEAGQSVSSLKKQVTDYATALQTSQQEQQDWNSSVQSSFSSAASASKDWATDQKLDLNQVATNLNEASTEYEKLPAAINKALSSGLTQAGLKMLESLPNGEQILSQIGLDSAGSAKLIAAANRAGKDAATQVSDSLTKVPPVDFKVTAIPDDSQARKERDFLSQDIKATVDTQADIKKASSQMQSLVAQKRTATVIADADTEKAKASIDQFIEQPRTAKISAAAETAKAEAQLKALEGKRSTTVFASADVAQAERQLQAFLSKPRSITVTVNQRRGTSVP